MRTSDVAKAAGCHPNTVLLGVSVDMLRNWERNNLLDAPRDPDNGYRYYGAEEISRLRVIRMLIRAGYSVMAILRMLRQLDGGAADDLRQAIDTPAPDEDVSPPQTGDFRRSRSRSSALWTSSGIWR